MTDDTHKFKIVLASDQQKSDRDIITYPEFGQKLSLRQYQDREENLRKTDWAKSAMRTWLLMDSRQTPLSSLETFRVSSRIKAQQDMQLGETELIASVVTEPKLRGNRYASILVQKVCDHLFQENSKLQAIALYSDVEPRLYGRIGFRERPATERVWPADNAARATDSTTHYSPPPGSQWLDSSQKNQIAENLQTNGFLSGNFALKLSRSILDWHWERQALYAAFLNQRVDSRIGLQDKNGTLYFAADFKNKALRILAIQGRYNPIWTPSLQTLAADWNLDQIIAWDHAENSTYWETAQIDTSPSRLVTRHNDAVPMIYPRPGVARTAETLAELWTHIARAFWV